MVVSNRNCEGALPADIDWVRTEDDLMVDYPIYQSDLVDPARPWRHNAEKLAQVLMDLLQERTGPLLE